MFCFRWYPPGHGDFYHSFYNSGVLDELIDLGKTICFMSNIDNMGATVDLGILSECMKDNAQFFMEVTDKTRADVKGGTLIQYEGKLRLLEVAQVSLENIVCILSFLLEYWTKQGFIKYILIEISTQIHMLTFQKKIS